MSLVPFALALALALVGLSSVVACSGPDRLRLNSFTVGKRFMNDGRPVYTVAVDDGVAFVTTGEGFLVIRINAGFDAEQLGTYVVQPEINEQRQPLALRDHILAMAQGSRIVFVDVRDPASLVTLATVPIESNGATGLAFDDHYLYYVGENMRRIDVTDPAHPGMPQILGAQPYQTIDFHGGHIFTTGPGNGLTIFDLPNPAIENPAAPPIGHVDVPTATAVHFNGDALYGVFSNAGQLWTVDVSDVTRPVRVDASGGNPEQGGRGLLVRGDQMLIPSTVDLTYDYDISSPLQPREVDARLIARGFDNQPNFDAALVGDIIVLANQGGVLVMTPTL